jgi:hypothetical protein
MSLSIARRGRIAASRRRTSFDPSTVTGLIRWYKADGTLYQDSAGTTPATADGDPVGYWTDASTSAAHSKQTTSTKRPTLKTGANGINGLPVIQFDGGDDYLSDGATISLKPFSIFAVFKPTNFSATRTIIGGHVNGMQFRADQPSGTLHLVKQGAVDLGSASSNLTAATAVLVAGTYDSSGNYTFRINRAAAGSGTNNQTIPTDSIYVGSNNAISEFMLGPIGEILIFNTVISGSDLTNIESYLSGRWGTP